MVHFSKYSHDLKGLTKIYEEIHQLLFVLSDLGVNVAKTTAMEIAETGGGQSGNRRTDLTRQLIST